MSKICLIGWLYLSSLILVNGDCNAQSGPHTHFPLMANGGWIGGDGAFSIALNDSTRLWLFGDTWVGQIKNAKRYNADITRNSIAIEGSDRQIHYYLPDGHQPFFINARRNEWYWPADGICINNTLYVFLSRLSMKNPGDSTGFGFVSVGEDVAIIHIGSSDPADWKIDYRPLPSNTPHLASAITSDEKCIYLFGDNGTGKHTTYIARVPIDNISDMRGIAYYYPKTMEWKSKFNASTYLFDAAPEFSVRYDAASKNFIAIYSKSGMSKYIMMRYARNITGPWSPEKIIAECPEMQRNKNYYAYEAKQKAPLKNDKSDILNITYLVNSFSFWDVARDTSIYVPQIIGVKNPLR